MHNFTVCVADDCVDEATMLTEGLQLMGYRTVHAHTGTEALEHCLSGDIDLLLLDIRMPDIDGHEVCRRLKDNDASRDLPIIFVTAKGSSEDVATGYRLGAVDYIAKPYNLPMVMVRVESAMRTRQMADYTRSQEAFIHDTAYTDQLTGLRNRRYLLERLQEEVDKAHRYGYAISCMVFDVDDVKAIDKDLGAVSLDDLLVELAFTMRNASRNYDILARYDGAVFAAVLPHAVLDDAVAYARKLAEEVGATTFSDPSFPTQAELRFGIVSCRNGSTKNAEDMVGEAMQRLFQAKSRAKEHWVAQDLA